MCVPRPRKGQTSVFLNYNRIAMKKFCALFFLAAMIFAGCSEKDDAIVENPNPSEETPGQPSETPDETPDEKPDETPVLTIGIEKYTFPAEGGSVRIPFKVNVDWETLIKYIIGDSGWLTLTPESGEAGSVVLTLTAEANSTTEQRKAFVRILYGGQSCELSIIQSKNDDDVDITAAFDPLFAQTLQKCGYIANANRITYREVRNITQINVSGGGLTSLQGIEFFSALTVLYCNMNQLTSLDVSKNTALTCLDCSSNQLTSLDVSKNTALKELHCYSNPLTSLDVSKNTALTWLHCNHNQLTSLDVFKNTALTWLDCADNQLTSLDVSKNTALITLYCNSNRLTSLDVSKNTALIRFDCAWNPGNGSVFYVWAWFDHNSIPTGPVPGDFVSKYEFTSGSWTYGNTIRIQYYKIR